MNNHNEFVPKLEEFLDSECDDYGIDYQYELENNYASVDLSLHGEVKTTVYFKHENRQLYINMGEDSWYKVDFFDRTVKYFWVKVAPDLWGDND